jgi:hypothetical protein
VKGEVRSIIVIEVLPGCQFCIEIHIIRVGQQLIKLSFVGSVGPFNFPVELRRSRFDVEHAGCPGLPHASENELETHAPDRF